QLSISCLVDQLHAHRESLIYLKIPYCVPPEIGGMNKSDPDMRTVTSEDLQHVVKYWFELFFVVVLIALSYEIPKLLVFIPGSLRKHIILTIEQIDHIGRFTGRCMHRRQADMIAASILFEKGTHFVDSDVDPDVQFCELRLDDNSGIFDINKIRDRRDGHFKVEALGI